MIDKAIPVIASIPIILVLIFVAISEPVESVPDRATETTQLLILNELVDMNAGIDSLESDIEVLNNRVAVTNTLTEANLQTFAIDGFSDRYFVQFIEPTNATCNVFDKVNQTDGRLLTCVEPFISLSISEKNNYNANFTLP